MRQTIIFSTLLLLSTPLFADESTEDRWRVSVLASEISSTGSAPYPDDPHAGLSVGLAYAPNPQWDIEGTVATQSHISPYPRTFFVVLPTGMTGPTYTSFEYRRYRVTPFDLSLTRHFLAGQVIAPYVRAGVRYVIAPKDPRVTTTPIVHYGPDDLVELPSLGFGFKDRASGQVGAGVRLRLTPRTAVRAEVNRLVRSDRVDYDPLTRFGIGVSWLF
jgi:hypothetical protein